MTKQFATFFVFLIDCKPNLVDIIVTLSNYLPDEVLKIHYTMIKSNGFSFYYIVFFITLKNVDLNKKVYRIDEEFHSAPNHLYMFLQNIKVLDNECIFKKGGGKINCHRPYI